VQHDHGYGYDVFTHTEVVPKPPPTTYTWRIGPVSAKAAQPPQGIINRRPFVESEVTLQLTADQQVELSIKGEDAHGNAVEITGDTQWTSSDESVVSVVQNGPEQATAVAVGPAGTASVTVTNDVDQDGTGDYMGSLAIDVVAGDLAEIVIEAGEPTDKL
jgi:hypothetical protein